MASRSPILVSHSSTLSAVLLKPLPYPQAENLYNIRTTLTDGRVTTGLLSNGEVSRLNAPNLPIVRAAAMQPADLTLLHDTTGFMIGPGRDFQCSQSRTGRQSVIAPRTLT